MMAFHVRVTILGFLALATGVWAADYVAIEPANRIAPEAPAWQDLVKQFEHQPDAIANFVEQRFFPFSKHAVVLKGEVRVSRERGLSLHYTAPEERTVILDQGGMVIREPNGSKSAPDPRANLANN